MSSGRSVDGLQKRTAKKGGSSTRATSSTAMTRRKSTKNVKVTKSTIASARHMGATKKVTKSRIQATRTTKRRTIGIPEDERELKRIQRANALNEEILTASRDKNISEEISDLAASEPSPEDDDREAVRDFLDNIKDSDPTDIAEIPERADSKKWHKKMKKEAKKNRKKKGKAGKIVALVILLLLLGGGYVAYRYFNNFIADVTDGGSLLGLITSDPDIPLEKDENGRTNILVFGTEGYDMDDPDYDGGFLTDSMMMISVDQETGDIKAVSLPRDLYETTHYCTATRKLNEVFWCTYAQTDGTPEQNKQYDKEGAKALEASFEEILGVEIHYYVHANWKALIDVIDAVGGLDVVFTYGDQTWDGPETEIKTTSPDGLADGWYGQMHYVYPNGEPVHLDGEHALAVARTRNAYGGWGADNGNFSREYFQQKIIEATLKKVKEEGMTLTTALGIKSAVGENIRTNFKDTEIKTMLNLANKLDFQHITTVSLFASDNDKQSEPLMTTGMIDGISYVYPSYGAGNYYQIHEYIKRRLNAGGFVDEEADIVILNGSDLMGAANTEREKLEALGYNITQVDNAPDDLSDFDGVKIFKRASDKSQTEAALKKQYPGYEVSTEVPASLDEYDEDFIIVLGER